MIKRRWLIPPGTQKSLEAAFLVDRFPSLSDRQRLATAFDVTPRKIHTWFQNKRSRSGQTPKKAPRSKAPRSKAPRIRHGEASKTDEVVFAPAQSAVAHAPLPCAPPAMCHALTDAALMGCTYRAHGYLTDKQEGGSQTPLRRTPCSSATATSATASPAASPAARPLDVSSDRLLNAHHNHEPSLDLTPNLAPSLTPVGSFRVLPPRGGGSLLAPPCGWWAAVPGSGTRGATVWRLQVQVSARAIAPAPLLPKPHPHPEAAAGEMELQLPLAHAEIAPVTDPLLGEPLPSPPLLEVSSSTSSMDLLDSIASLL